MSTDATVNYIAFRANVTRVKDWLEITDARERERRRETILTAVENIKRYATDSGFSPIALDAIGRIWDELHRQRFSLTILKSDWRIFEFFIREHTSNRMRRTARQQ